MKITCEEGAYQDIEYTEDVEYTGVGFVEISRIFARQDALFLEENHLTIINPT